jgi:hypothetical protein
MAKVKFNVKGVEKRSGDLSPIPKGVYDAKIESCAVTKPEGKDERIEVVYVISDGDSKGRKLFEYVNLESEEGAWRVRQFLEAVGLVTDKKETGSFEPEKLVGTEVKVRVVHQADKRTGHEGEISSRVGAVWAPGAEDEEDEDLDEDEKDGEDGDDDEVDLDELDRKELKALIKEQGLEIKVSKSMSDQDIRDAIAEALGESDEDDEDADDDEDEDDEDEVDLDELDRAALKKLIKDQELDIKVKKSHSDDDIRKLIAAELGDDEDEDDDDDEEDEQDYDSLSVEDLRATCKERGLSDKGSKKVIIKRLEKDDEASKDGKDPF